MQPMSPMSPEGLMGAALAGVGFAWLVRASPLGGLRFKPFTCRTCLSGWGALAFGVLRSCADPADPGPVVSVLVRYGAELGILLLAGTGGAALLFAAMDALGTIGTAPTPNAEGVADLPPPPPLAGGIVESGA